MTEISYGDVRVTVNSLQAEFPYPPEVTGGSYHSHIYLYGAKNSKFPSPTEVTGVSNGLESHRLSR